MTIHVHTDYHFAIMILKYTTEYSMLTIQMCSNLLNMQVEKQECCKATTILLAVFGSHESLAEVLRQLLPIYCAIRGKRYLFAKFGEATRPSC